MTNLTEIFSNPVSKALGWTLVHACWQMLVMGATYFLVVLISSKAKLRYQAGMGLLMLQLILSIFTYILLYQKALQNHSIQEFTSQLSSATFFGELKMLLSINLPLIVSLWLLGSVVLFTRLGLAYVYVNQLRNKCVDVAESNLQELLSSLKMKMHINSAVQIKVSNQVHLPMLLGVLKPLIIIPASIVSGLSQVQLELIVAHELAHLKRQDYLWNGIQSVIEILYFFHPILWILSSQIRQERENACDDLALEYSGNKLLLAKTLIQLQEQSRIPQLALTFGKKTNVFFARIQRIAGLKSNRSFTKESLWIVCGIGITIFAFAQKPTAQASKPGNSLSRTISADTSIVPTSKKSTSIIHEINGLNFEIKNQKVYVNGKEVTLSEEIQQKVTLKIAEIEKQQLKIEKQSALIEAQSNKMANIHSQIVENSEPIQKINVEMCRVSDKMSDVGVKYGKLMGEEGISEKEMNKLTQKMEKEMAKYEKEMEALADQMNQIADDREAFSSPMDSLAQEMDALSAPIDVFSDEIDKNVTEIMELLPEAIQKEISQKKKRIAPPPPPKPPKLSQKMRKGPPPPPPGPPPPPPPPPPPAPRVPRP